MNSPHKGQWSGALMFSLIWINSWVNTREAGDLRRHRAHSDVIVMKMLAYEDANFLPIAVRDIWRKVSPLKSKSFYFKFNYNSSSTCGSECFGSKLAKNALFLQLLSLVHYEYWRTLTQYSMSWGVCLVWFLHNTVLKWGLGNIWYKKHAYVICLEGNYQ